MHARSLLAALLTIPVSIALAADWPQWRGPLHNGHVPAGQPLPTKLPDEPKTIWKTDIADGYASPIVAHGRLFCLDTADEHEVARAYDAATGKQLWATPLGPIHKDGFGFGPRCTPIADADRVYFQTCRGEFRCLSAADGKTIWRTNFVDDFGAIYIGEKGNAQGAARHGATGPGIIDGHQIILQVGSKNGASLVAFDKLNGKVLWKSGNDQSAYAGLTITEIAGVRQCIAFTAESLLAVDPRDGRQLWRHPLSTKFGRHVTTPIVFENLVIVSSHTLGLVAIRIEKHGDTLTPTPAWTNKSVAINFTNPVALGPLLFTIGPRKNLLCVDLNDGQVKWEKDGLFITGADKAVASFLVLDDTILMLTDAGQLIHFTADSTEYKELGRAQVSGFNWCNPAYADGRLYLRDNRNISPQTSRGILMCRELIPPPQ